jgi:S1-C subfamily serine protease
MFIAVITKKVFLLVFVFLFCISPSCLFALEQTTFFNQQWLKSVVSIEKLIEKEKSEKSIEKDKFQPIGTGFLINTKTNHHLLVTAKHVVTDDEGNIKSNLTYRINLKAGDSIIINDTELKSKGGGTWFLSETSDIAVRFIPHAEIFDIVVITQDMFLKKEYIQSGTPALILGFPMGLRSEKYATPIVRNAIVALEDRDALIIDGFAFPGNSGGPVVYMPAFQLGNIGISNYIAKQLILGVVSSYIPYTDIAVSLQTKHPRITFEENSGLTLVVPADKILELMSRDDVKKLDNELK